MDSGLTLRPAAAVAADAGRFIPPSSAPSSARSELAQSKTVTPVTRSETVNLTPDRRIVIDQQTHDVVFQVLDQESGTVVDQLPSETKLKVRAYFKALDAELPHQANVTA